MRIEKRKEIGLCIELESLHNLGYSKFYPSENVLALERKSTMVWSR